MKTIFKDLMLFFKNSIANMFTFLNLALGCLSLLYMINDKYFIASIFILAGTLIDRFDGKIARKLDTTSSFGKELDSLADLVTFGLAPAILIWSLKLAEIHLYGTVVAVVYILAGAFRLARFNCTEADGIYIGVPITIAGGFMALLSLVIMNHRTGAYINLYVTAVIMLALSYSMITTKIRIAKK